MYLIETGEFVDPKNKQKLQRKPTDFERHNCKWLVESQPTPAELNCDVPMTYIDIEHALCEFYRYRSLQEGLPTRPAIYQESVGVV